MELSKKFECEKITDEIWNQAIAEAQECLAKLLYKRKLKTMMRYVGTAATNLLASKLFNGEVDRRNIIGHGCKTGDLKKLSQQYTKQYIGITI